MQIQTKLKIESWDEQTTAEFADGSKINRADTHVQGTGLEIVEGSGSGDLTGISGSAESRSRHQDYPFIPLSLTYSLK